MAEQCDLSMIEPPSHVAVGRALRKCLTEALREPELLDWKIDFDASRVLQMIEMWAERGLADNVPYFDECVELVTATSRIAAHAQGPLARIAVVPFQDYLIALTGVVRLLASSSDDLELLSWFLRGSGEYGSCSFQVCLDELANQTHDYGTFNVEQVQEWRFAVNAFDRITLPAASLVQWLSQRPPCEFEEPMI